MATLRKQVGALVRHHRERRGLNQADLAQQAGKSLETISRIERGVVAPSFETLDAFAQALGVEVRDLFGSAGFAAADGREDALTRLIQRLASLNTADLEWIDRVVEAILGRAGRKARSPDLDVPSAARDRAP